MTEESAQTSVNISTGKSDEAAENVRQASRRNAVEFPESLNYDHVSPATRLLEKRRQVSLIQESLVLEKVEYMKREERFKQRDSQLQEKKEDFRKSLTKFNRFLKENEVKSQRAVKKQTEERTLQKGLESEKENLLKELAEIKVKQEKLEEELEEKLIYKNYLLDIKEMSVDDFPEISDILKRHRILKRAYENVKEKEMRFEKLTEETLNAKQELSHGNKDCILERSSTLSQLQNDLEKTKTLKLRYNNILAQQEETNLEKVLELGDVCYGIEHILSLCLTKFGRIIKHVQTKNVLHNLDIEDSKAGLTANVSLSSVNADERLKEQVQLALDNLEIIIAYVRDFDKIVGKLEQLKT